MGFYTACLSCLAVLSRSKVCLAANAAIWVTLYRFISDRGGMTNAYTSGESQEATCYNQNAHLNTG